MKLFIVAYATIQLYLNSKINNNLLEKLFLVLIFLFVLGLIGNFLLGESWNRFFSKDIVQYRYGFIRPAGYFGHYAPNSYFFSMALITLFMLSAKTRSINKAIHIKKFFLLVIVDFMAAFPLTVRKGLFMIIPYGAYIFSLLSRAERIIFSLVASLFFIFFIFFISDTIMYADTKQNFSNFFSGDHAYLRGLIVYHGISLFFEFFPYGVGNGLYGTFFSNFNFSVYQYVGLDPSIFIRDNGALSAVYDSGISALLAETGFVGFITFSFLIFTYFKYNKYYLDNSNYQIFKVITYFALILSITEPVWQNGFFTTFYISCLLFIYTKNDKYKVLNKWHFFDPTKYSQTTSFSYAKKN
ncbi:hypothetical protein [Rhodoferax sp.]|uniref:hypothetical protein n=1 Tax=Rhodoferax sp. TaxID=50421 RepID=UPI00262319E8|nr:hypothetical protein [Rhodoferax sp.]MDD3934902.1 hypothetical protein [Rhodoferax sp.]